MATFYITEYSDALRNNGTIQIAMEPSNGTQTVAISGVSAQSTALQNNTSLVRVTTDSICSFHFGTNPTATTTTRRLAADQVEYFGVPTGQAYKIAVIANT